MNRIYRSIWNDTSGTLVAVSENVKSAGKKASPGATAVAGGARFALKALAVSLMMAFGANVFALPVGGVVVDGGAGISSSGSSTTITQSTQNVAINWQSFNIGATEAVQFIQPNSSSVALNRVLGPDPSSILGSLSANGKVFLLNPNGILFGRGASINVGGLVASTLNISDDDFMAGRYQFSGSSDAAVLNQGTINAPGGYVALLGANVGNDGIILARLGTVALAAGSAMTLDVAGDGLLNVAVSQGAVNALVENGGLIQADGGQVLLTAKSAGSLLQSAVNNTGVIQAQTIENRNGTIRLLGDMQSGTMTIGGTLDVSGTAAGQTGGNVTVTGHHVGLFGANINASGDAGGGTVLIGGGYQGNDPAVQNAAATYMSADSTIRADAVTNGNGGKVILWSDNTTRFYGDISARGAAQGGDGGFVEVSGKNTLDFGGRVDLLATAGNAGTLLLDPLNIIIVAANPDLNGDGVTGDDLTSSGIFFADNPGATSTITTAALIAQLVTGNVTLQANNDITANSALTFGTASRTLELVARNDVIINAALAANGTNSGFKLSADQVMRINATITTTAAGGSIDISAGNNVHVDAALSGSGAPSTINVISGQDVVATAAIDVSGASSVLNLIAARDVISSAAITTAGATTVMKVIADNDGTGPGAAAGTVRFLAGSALTASGAMIIRFNPVDYSAVQVAAEIAAYNAAPRTYPVGMNDVKAWVFGNGDNKVYDGTRTATVSGLEPDLGGLAPAAVLGAVTSALFDTKHVGTAKPITYATVFADPTFDLFAPAGFAAGTYLARADITVRPLTIAAASDTRVYNGTISSAGVPTVTGLQIGDVPDTLNGPLTQAYASKDVLGVDNSVLVPTGPYAVNDNNGGNNYAITVNNAAGTITPAPLPITADPKTKTYGAADPALTYTTGAFQTGDSAATVLSGGLVRVAGETVAASPYAINQGTLVANANYTIAYTPANLIITGASLILTADSATKVYGQTFTPLPTAFLNSPPVGLMPGETVTAVAETSTGSVSTASVVGSAYPILITPGSASGTGGFNQSNYTITYLPGALTVTPAPLTIRANDNTKVYGQTFTPAGTAFTTTALQNGETVGSVTEVSPAGMPPTAPVPGPYAITPSAATGGTFTPSNYTITYVDGALTVTPLILPAVPPGIPPVLPIVPDIPIEVTEAIMAPSFVMSQQMFPATGPAWLPAVVDTRTPPQLLSIALPPPVVVPPPRVEEEAPPIYVPPVRPPKQDRN